MRLHPIKSNTNKLRSKNKPISSFRAGAIMFLVWAIFVLMMVSMLAYADYADKSLGQYKVWALPFERPLLLDAVVVTDHDAVVKICSQGMSNWDDGREIIDPNRIGGCYDVESRIIIVDVEYPKILVHELCHAAGWSNKICSGVRWPTAEGLTKLDSYAIIHLEVKDNGHVIKRIAILP